MAKSVLPDLPPPSSNGDDTIEMPDVGGILPQDNPIIVIALAVILSIVLPTAGLIKLRQTRLDDTES